MQIQHICCQCGTTEKYQAKGLCKSCYFKAWSTDHDRAAYHAAYRAQRGGNMVEREAVRYSHDPHVRARRLIQRRVATGMLPKAIDCICTDCGGQASEYDHYLGYEKPFDAMVQPVCRNCHCKRTVSLQQQREATSPDIAP